MSVTAAGRLADVGSGLDVAGSTSLSTGTARQVSACSNVEDHEGEVAGAAGQHQQVPEPVVAETAAGTGPGAPGR